MLEVDSGYNNSSLPDAAYAVIDTSKVTKKENGISTPNTARFLPHHTAAVKDPNENSTVDLKHLRVALARMGQIKTSPALRAKAKAHLIKHARVLLPNSQFTKSLENGVLREVIEQVICGRMDVKNAINCLEVNPSEMEGLLIAHFNGDRVLPEASYAIQNLFPHHNASVTNPYEHGSVNISLLKLQIARVQNFSMPAGLRFRVMAHLIGHARSLIPSIKFVQNDERLRLTYGKPVTTASNHSIMLDGMTEDSSGHIHAYNALVHDTGHVIGEARTVSSGSDHSHLFSGMIKPDGTMPTHGPDAGKDHMHMINFTKKAEQMPMPMQKMPVKPDEMTMPMEPDKMMPHKGTRLVKVGSMTIELPQR